MPSRRWFVGIPVHLSDGTPAWGRYCQRFWTRRAALRFIERAENSGVLCMRLVDGSPV